jgi:hypothetical protein
VVTGLYLTVQVDIAKIIPRWVMHSSLTALFGAAFVDSLDGGLDAFLSQFEQFDKLFEVRIHCIMLVHTRSWLHHVCLVPADSLICRFESRPAVLLAALQVSAQDSHSHICRLQQVLCQGSSSHNFTQHGRFCWHNCARAWTGVPLKERLLTL